MTPIQPGPCASASGRSFTFGTTCRRSSRRSSVRHGAVREGPRRRHSAGRTSGWRRSRRRRRPAWRPQVAGGDESRHGGNYLLSTPTFLHLIGRRWWPLGGRTGIKSGTQIGLVARPGLGRNLKLGLVWTRGNRDDRTRARLRGADAVRCWQLRPTCSRARSREGRGSVAVDAAAGSVRLSPDFVKSA